MQEVGIPLYFWASCVWTQSFNLSPSVFLDFEVLSTCNHTLHSLLSLPQVFAVQELIALLLQVKF